jgi:multidrug efflux pump
MHPTDLFIRRPVLAAVVSALIFFVGLRAFFDLQIRQFPDLQSSSIGITTTYPGAAPELMQGFITTPIEQALSSAQGIDYMTASSGQGRSTITVYLTLNYDPDKALTEIMSKVQQVKNQIPREANDPVVAKQSSLGNAGSSIMILSFSSDQMKSPQITDFLSRTVQPVLSTVPGVGSADIAGADVFAMRLWLDPQRMAARGITGADVAAALLANNVQSAPGQTKGFFTVANIVADTGLKDVDQFRDMVVKATGGGALVRVRDIATVELDQQSETQSGWIDDRKTVMMLINQAPTGNPLDTAKEVRKRLKEFEPNLPPELKAKVVYDATLYIQSAIDEVSRTLAEAVAVVVVVVFLSLGSLRAVAIPLVTIPLSIVGSAALMLAAGFSINLLTLLAMVLAIGLVVDDAIVVVENVHRHLNEGYSPVQAALVGAREIVGPVIAMTLTLAAVYAPIGLLSGVTGVMFREFAFSLAGSVIISGVIALTLSPVMASGLLTRNMSDGRFAQIVEHLYERLTLAYARRLDIVLQYRPAVVLFAVVILGSVFFLYTGSRSELAPPEDQGYLFGPLKGPQYANLDYLDAYGRQFYAEVAKIPEVERVVNFNGQGSNLNAGMFVFHFKEWSQRNRSSAQIQAQLQALASRITGVRINIFGPSSIPGSIGGPPVQMVISSIDGYETVFRVMNELKAEAYKSGLFAFVDSDLDYNTPMVKLKIDHAKANDLGISMLAISNSLAALTGENYVNRFALNGRSYEVIPQVPRAQRLSADALTQFYVTTVSGQQIPLSTIVSVEEATGPNALVEYNQLNSATFQAVPMPGVTMGQAVSFLEEASQRMLPAGFRHSYLSDARQYVTEGNALVLTFGFALLVIYLVLAAQFESVRDPLVILVSVPMSIFGALLPLFFGTMLQIPGATVNIYSQVGMVTLIGLISKHGILMVTFANELQRREGLSRVAAIRQAARIRLRPILMTTAAMVLGVVPLLLATGAGAASRVSIGIVIASGMTIGTMFTLFVLPTVYTFLAQDHRATVSSRRTHEIAALG